MHAWLESMTGRKARTYQDGRVVTHSTDVTQESKVDANAGTTAAAGLATRCLVSSTR